MRVRLRYTGPLGTLRGAFRLLAGGDNKIEPHELFEFVTGRKSVLEQTSRRQMVNILMGLELMSPLSSPVKRAVWNESDLRKSLQEMLVRQGITACTLFKAWDATNDGCLTKKQFLARAKRLVIGSDGIDGSEMWYGSVRPAVKHVFEVYGINDTRRAQALQPHLRARSALVSPQVMGVEQFESFLNQDLPAEYMDLLGVPSPEDGPSGAQAAAPAAALRTSHSRTPLAKQATVRTKKSSPRGHDAQGVERMSQRIDRPAERRGDAKAEAKNAVPDRVWKLPPTTPLYDESAPARSCYSSRRLPKDRPHSRILWDGQATSGWESRLTADSVSAQRSPRGHPVSADGVLTKRKDAASPYGGALWGKPVREAGSRASTAVPLGASTSLPLLPPRRVSHGPLDAIRKSPDPEGKKAQRYEATSRRYGVDPTVFDGGQLLGLLLPA